MVPGSLWNLVAALHWIALGWLSSLGLWPSGCKWLHAASSFEFLWMSNLSLFSTHRNMKACGHLGSLGGTAPALAAVFVCDKIGGLLKWPKPFGAFDLLEQWNPKWISLLGPQQWAQPWWQLIYLTGLNFGPTQAQGFDDICLVLPNNLQHLWIHGNMFHSHTKVSPLCTAHGFW